MLFMMLFRSIANATGAALSVSLATRVRKIVVCVFVIVAFSIGVHLAHSSDAQIAKTEKQIHQQDAREAAQFSKAKPPKPTPTCTTTVKSGTHTVKVDAKGRVSTSHTSGTTSKTCK